MGCRVKLADYVMEFIAAQGVKHVFMLSGGGAMHLDDSLGRCAALTYVCCLHEQACAIAAEAYAKQTGNLGVALVTTGPGGTNAVTGVAGAWLDSTPVLVLSGQVKRADLKGDTGVRQLGVQEVDIVSIVKPITKEAVTITDPLSIRYHLERLIALAHHGRPGPVWIDIPLDVQAATIEPDGLPRFVPAELPQVGQPAELPAQVARVVTLLQQAKRPVLLIGNGVRLAGGYDVLRQVLDSLSVPVLVATSLGIDLVAEDHPRFFGRPGPIAPRYANFTLQNSDLLVVIGARLDMAMTGYSHERFARAAKKVQVDIDATELSKMRTPIEVPIQADAADFLHELLRQVPSADVPDFRDWVNRCRQWKSRYPVVLDEFRERRELVSLYHFTDVLCDQLAPDEVVVACSSGNAVELFHLVYKAKAGQRVIHTRGLGAMGFGLPAAIGACLAAGGRRTICLEGDGGLQLNIQELETLRRLDLPVKLFVVNNDGYASIRLSQRSYFDRLCGADATSGVTLPSLEKIASAYAIPYFALTSHDGLTAAIRQILDHVGPAICEVFVPADEPRMPRMTSYQKADGSMASKPLEDLWPFLDRDEFHAQMFVPVLDD
ncbi:MAG: thiamine pyrophosphate-binding protein [Planctomycetota bacterium]|nr:thiamine pyrophosphate-binding protein [Planctomycetota bacterium]